MPDEKKQETTEETALCEVENTDADELIGDPVNVNEWGEE